MFTRLLVHVQVILCICGHVCDMDCEYCTVVCCGRTGHMREKAGQAFCADFQCMPAVESPWRAWPCPCSPGTTRCPRPMSLLWMRRRTVSLGDCSHLCHHPTTLCGSSSILGSSTLLAMPVPRRCHQPRIQTPKPTQMGPRRSLWLQHSHLHPPRRPPHPHPPQTQMCPSRNPLEAESQVRPEPAFIYPWEAVKRRSPLLFHS